MSNHHTHRSINLHHAQVNAGRARREHRQAERMQNYLAMRRQHYIERNFVLVCGFICFAYIALATAVYLGYIT